MSTNTTDIKKQTTNAQSIPSNWSETDMDKFGWEQFQRGEAHQKKKSQAEVQTIFDKNVGRATTLSENIFHIAQEDYCVNIKKALLKIDTLHQYEALFLVDKADYLSDKIKEVYLKSQNIKSDFNCDDFYISFKFMPFSETLNRDCIHNDGFTLEYGQRKQKSKPSKA
ncbi:hypothetical protein EZJ43_01270 [Pedobacter changchengzhani]|uniref:Uncharacterized protein n=1 Tax=Pedobacter changchengzhani TaxID=2529274 RepID=A0A4V3A0M1_9SPHI|nr:hypothetical protein [Pedobacter changchengzhani]TDG37753.1 hypothetical protein EZJ43_01270 [Pedobacter changchengzhani]